MTVWELAACVDGVRRANGIDDPVPPPDGDDLERLKQQAAQVHGQS